MESFSTLEIIAVVGTLLYVALAAKENKWCWLFGGIGSGIYVYLNFNAALYFNGVLQIYYVAVAMYGILLWNKKDEEALVITNIPKKGMVILLFLGIVASFLLFKLGDVFFSTHFSLIDAVVTVFSLFATWLTVKKQMESWLLWIAVDALAVYMYFSVHLYLTAGLYIVLCAMAIYAFFQWKKAAEG